MFDPKLRKELPNFNRPAPKKNMITSKPMAGKKTLAEQQQALMWGDTPLGGPIGGSGGGFPGDSGMRKKPIMDSEVNFGGGGGMGARFGGDSKKLTPLGGYGDEMEGFGKAQDKEWGNDKAFPVPKGHYNR